MTTNMRKLLSTLALGLLLALNGNAQLRFPIKGGVLQDNLDANSKGVTNLGSVAFSNGLTLTAAGGTLYANGQAVGTGTGGAFNGTNLSVSGSLSLGPGYVVYTNTPKVVGLYGTGVGGMDGTYNQTAAGAWTNYGTAFAVTSNGVITVALSNGVTWFTLVGGPVGASWTPNVPASAAGMVSWYGVTNQVNGQTIIGAPAWPWLETRLAAKVVPGDSRPISLTNGANSFAGNFAGSGSGLTDIPWAAITGSTALTNNSTNVTLNTPIIHGGLTIDGPATTSLGNLVATGTVLVGSSITATGSITAPSFVGNLIGNAATATTATTAAIANTLAGAVSITTNTVAAVTFQAQTNEIIVYTSPQTNLVGHWYYWMTDIYNQYVYTNSVNRTNYLTFSPDGQYGPYIVGFYFDSMTNDYSGATILYAQYDNLAFVAPRNPWESPLASTVPVNLVADYAFNAASTNNISQATAKGPPYVSSPLIGNPLTSILYFPFVGPSQSWINRLGFGDIHNLNSTNDLAAYGLLYLSGGAGVVRGIQVMPAALADWSYRTNYWLRIYADGGGMSPVSPNSNYLVFNAPLTVLASCKYATAALTNYAWSSRYVDCIIIQTNISLQQANLAPEIMLNLKFVCPFTNGIFISFYDASNQVDVSSGIYSTVNYSLSTNGLMGIPYNTWRLRSSFIRGTYLGTSTNTFLNVTNKPGVIVGFWGSVNVGASATPWAFENTWIVKCDDAMPYWQSSGGEDLPLNPYEFAMGGGIAQYDYGTPNWSRSNHVEFYRQFSTDAIYWNNSALGQIAFATTNVPADILVIYYAP